MSKKTKKWMITTTAAAALLTAGIGMNSNVSAKEDVHKPSQVKTNSAQAISKEQAKKIAAAASKQSKIEDIEFKRINGTLYYEVEFDHRDDEHDELYIDAITGAYTWEKDMKLDDDDHDDEFDDRSDRDDHYDAKPSIPSQGSSSNHKPAGIITKQQAIKIALASVPGTVEEVDTDDEHGRLVYEIEINTNDHREAEVKVTSTGTILEIDWEDED